MNPELFHFFTLAFTSLYSSCLVSVIGQQFVTRWHPPELPVVFWAPAASRLVVCSIGLLPVELSVLQACCQVTCLFFRPASRWVVCSSCLLPVELSVLSSLWHCGLDWDQYWAMMLPCLVCVRAVFRNPAAAQLQPNCLVHYLRSRESAAHFAGLCCPLQMELRVRRGESRWEMGTCIRFLQLQHLTPSSLFLCRVSNTPWAHSFPFAGFVMAVMKLWAIFFFFAWIVTDRVWV